jgi:Asp-tRNA(Asn)/Glu-tRNA(Gln) amidotransferase A subunit family amidase
MVPIAHGNDGGGSIRIPASCCGLFGLKPTRARNPGQGYNLLAQDHALTRSVRDSAALMDAICGPDSGDPYWAPPPARPYAQEVGADPGRLRIAFATRAPRGSAVHPDCARAVEDAARLCADLGHSVDEGAPDVDAAQYDRAFTVMFAAGLAAAIDGIGLQAGVAPAAAMFEPATWAMYRVGKAATASDYLLAVAAVQQLTRQMAVFLSRRCDLWLTPTLAAPPPPLGTFDFGPEQFPLEAGERLLTYLAFTPICNSTGLPAASVPLHWNDADLPVGVQFVAPYGGEDVLFRLAAQLEAARPRARRRPPGSA